MTINFYKFGKITKALEIEEKEYLKRKANADHWYSLPKKKKGLKLS